jgi:hypothetical protein
MANIGFKFTRRGQNVLTTNAQKIAFSSAYPLDKILFEFQGAANATKPHGLGYKPTTLSWGSTGVKGVTFIDNYQLTIAAAGANRAIVLLQQGS